MGIARFSELLTGLCFAMGGSIGLLGLASMILMVLGFRGIVIHALDFWEEMFWSFVLLVLGFTSLAWSLWTGRLKRTGFGYVKKAFLPTIGYTVTMFFDLMERKVKARHSFSGFSPEEEETLVPFISHVTLNYYQLIGYVLENKRLPEHGEPSQNMVV